MQGKSGTASDMRFSDLGPQTSTESYYFVFSRQKSKLETPTKILDLEPQNCFQNYFAKKVIIENGRLD
jgi:hypothetical protein